MNLTVNNIQQYYGGSHILRDVSLEAKQGEVTVLLGRNGVGKTTSSAKLAHWMQRQGHSVLLAAADTFRAALAQAAARRAFRAHQAAPALRSLAPGRVCRRVYWLRGVVESPHVAERRRRLRGASAQAAAAHARPERRDAAGARRRGWRRHHLARDAGLDDGFRRGAALRQDHHPVEHGDPQARHI